MSELYPSEAELNSLSGTIDAEQEVLYVAAGESPYYTSFYRMLYRLLDVCRRSGDLRVYKDGALTFGVRGGQFMNGDTAVEYAGSDQNALSDNATNYVYLTAGGVLTVSTSSFPAPSATPHVPLASIVTADGEYGFGDITDYRGRSMARVLSGMTAAGANLVAGRLHSLAITAGAEAGGVRAVTVQGKDLAGADLPARLRVRMWIAPTEYDSPSAANNTVALTAGGQLAEVSANADYELVCDATGKVVFNLTLGAAGSRYVMAECDGHIWSSGELVWTLA